jgi:hypothetical protein
LVKLAFGLWGKHFRAADFFVVAMKVFIVSQRIIHLHDCRVYHNTSYPHIA